MMSESVMKILAHRPKISVARFAGARKNCSNVPPVCSFLTLCPTPHTEVLKRTMNTKPKKKYAIPISKPWVEGCEATGTNNVTPSAKKKNHSGVLMNSPISHAGYRT